MNIDNQFLFTYNIAKADLFKNKIMAHFMKHHNVLPIKRNSNDVQGTKKMIEILKEKQKTISYLQFGFAVISIGINGKLYKMVKQKEGVGA